MRVVEATAAGVVAAVVVVVVMARIAVEVDPVITGAVAFLVGFLVVMLRADRRYVDRG